MTGGAMRHQRGEGEVKTTFRSIAVAAGALLTLGVAPALALTSEQIAACDKRGASAESRVTNCTAVIEGTKSASLKSKARARKADALIDRGDALKAKGDVDGALRDYTEALTLDKDNTSVLFKRGMIYRDRGERDQAIADLDCALKSDKRSIELMNALSHLYYD
jgi:tetratricopeptide (TPR) repeat protein